MTALSAAVAKHATLPAISATVTTTTPGAPSPATNEVQTVTLDGGAVATGGTFTLTYAGQTTGAIAYDASAATIKTALEALSNIEAGHVSVAGTLNDGIVVTFGAVVTITAGVTTTTAGDDDPATDEVQQIDLGADQVATGGTFTITYSGQTTAAIAYNANAAAIQAALEALSNLAPGDVIVTGTLNTDIVITFAGTLAATNVDAVTVSVAATTGVSALSAADVDAMTVSTTLTTGTSADALTVTLAGALGSRAGNKVVVVNRHASSPLFFKYGATDPGEFGLAADDSYVVMPATKSDPLPLDNLSSFVVRVVGVPAVTYSVHVLPG